MTHKLLVGAALAVTAAPLVRKYHSHSRHSSHHSHGLGVSGSGSGSSPKQAAAGGPAAVAALKEWAQWVRGACWCN